MDEETKKLFMIYSKLVYKFCYHLTGNRIDADDLYQDTFLAAWEKREIFRDNMSHEDMCILEQNNRAKNYLLGIAANLWKNRQRKRLRRNHITPFDDRENALMEAVSRDPGPETNILQKEMIQEVRKQIEALPDKLKIVVVMYYTGEMSTEEIAGRLRIPAATVRSRLSKARKKMQKGLEENGYEKRYG